MLKKLNSYLNTSDHTDEVQQLRQELEDLKQRFSRLSQSLEASFSRSNKNSASAFILVHLNKIIHRIPVANIVMMEALDNYTMIYLMDGTRHMTSKTLQYWDEELAGHQNFIRTHRSWTVNMDYLQSIDTENQELLMINDTKIKYSRTRKKEILDLLENSESCKKLIPLHQL